jgi:hypothetical protein
MTDFESRLRDSLAERAEDVLSPSGLAAGARARLRRRRMTLAKIVAGAAMVVAAPFAISLVDVEGSGVPATPEPDPPPTRNIVRDPAPEFPPARPTTQEITWQGIRFMVPSGWQLGVTTAWCKEGRKPAAVTPRIALPDQVASKVACKPTSGYGVTVASAVGFDPKFDSRYVWQYDTEGADGPALHPDGAWLSYWYDDEWVVTIATPDPGLTSRIALSVRGDEVDVNGCAVAYDDVATRTTRGPRGVGAALCRYSTEGELEDSRRLTIVELDAALAAIAAAPELPGGDHCIQEEGWWVTLTPAGGSAYLARYGTRGAGSCQDGVESTAAEPELGPSGYFEITSAVRTAFGLDDLPVE